MVIFYHIYIFNVLAVIFICLLLYLWIILYIFSSKFYENFQIHSKVDKILQRTIVYLTTYILLLPFYCILLLYWLSVCKMCPMISVGCKCLYYCTPVNFSLHVCYICFIYLGAPTVGAYKSTNVTSSSWIDPFIII